MKILVAVKQVANLDDEFEISHDGKDVDHDYCDYEINEWDDYSLEEALLIKENNGDEGEIVVVTVGPEDAEDELRKCLGKGADRGIRVWDDAISGSDQYVTAKILAKVVEKENPDMVFIGVQAADHAFAQTGISVAQILGWPHAAVVSSLDYSPHYSPEKGATLRRELEAGLEEEITIDCPAVLTIQLGINEPRYASLRGIKQAAGKPLDELTHADLGLSDDDVGEAGSVSRIRRMFVPERAHAELIEGTPAEQATRLAEIIKEFTGA
jgi:electron transfer flavoprotein beta subunit